LFLKNPLVLRNSKGVRRKGRNGRKATRSTFLSLLLTPFSFGDSFLLSPYSFLLTPLERRGVAKHERSCKARVGRERNKRRNGGKEISKNGKNKGTNS